ncbi:MAG: hypothetical protein ACJA0U_002428 [Salibacteraceae bacterium]|jgi:hypothetical protein
MKYTVGLIAVVFIIGACSSVKVVVLEKPEGSIYIAAQTEPSIAIDPKNNQHIIAGAILDEFYESFDGGKSWDAQNVKSTYGVYGDPVMMFDTASQIYYFHLASYVETSHLDRIVCQTKEPTSLDLSTPTSFNNGTFPTPNGTKVQDKQWTVVNQETNEIYMTWTQFDAYNSKSKEDSSFIMFSKSNDQSLTWSEPLRISKHGGDCIDDDNTVEGAVPAVGPNGEIYVTWTGPMGLVFQKSLDGGSTWMESEIVLQEQFGGWTLEVPGIYRANGLPILKCDLSNGSNRGNLYLNWCDQKNGEDNTDSWMMKSTDGGATWSDRIRVNQDGSNKHQFFTWMTIDQSSGYLYFVYYDRRNYDDTQTDVYLSTSRDGGKTFVDTKISKKAFIPSVEMFFGDYLNIDAVDGQIRPIWPSMKDEKIKLHVALISEKGLKK